jgi:HSP20 family protein
MKTLSLYRPNTVLSDFDRYFESFFGDSVFAPAAKVFNRLPAADIRETEKSYVLDMELPGFSEKDIEVNVDGSNLSISSKLEDAHQDGAREADTRQDGAHQDGGTWLLRERHVNSFCRSFRLPENANPEEVSAEFKNGILRMEIKKRAEAQKRAIRIEVK